MVTLTALSFLVHCAPNMPAAEARVAALAALPDTQLAEAELPWEAEDVAHPPHAEPPPSLAFPPLPNALAAAVGFYRREIGPMSVSRCPYAVSCSTLALSSLRRYGLLGLLPFVDRFFFREGADAQLHYARRVQPSGVLKLDDSLTENP
jgi:hypothetical protein